MPVMTLLGALPELVRDIEGALVRLGRGDVADQIRAARLETWRFDDFAQATYLDLSAGQDRAVEETISLFDDIGVNVDLNREGRAVGVEVFGYEQSLARLEKNMR